MKDQLSRVTTELHNNSSNVGTLNEKTSELERQLGTEKEELEKRQAELKVNYQKMSNYMFINPAGFKYLLCFTPVFQSLCYCLEAPYFLLHCHAHISCFFYA